MMIRFPHWVAAGLAVGLVLFGLYYPWRFFSLAGSFAFSGPEPWQALRGIDADAAVTLGLRTGWFVMWLVPVLATEAMILAALRLCFLLLRGVYFEPPTIRAVQWVGGLAALAGASALIALMIEPWLMTSANIVAPRLPLAFRYNTGEIGVSLVGLGVFLVALVMRLAMTLQAENKEFI